MIMVDTLSDEKLEILYRKIEANRKFKNVQNEFNKIKESGQPSAIESAAYCMVAIAIEESYCLGANDAKEYCPNARRALPCEK